MAESTKKITFEAQDTGVENLQDRIKKSATELSREIIKSGAELGRVSSENIKSLEEEIALIDKRNRLYRDSRKVEAENRYSSQIERDSSPASRKKAKQALGAEMEDIKTSGRQDDLQTAYLKEILDTLRSTAREQIRSDKKGVERAIRSYERGKLGDLTPEEELTLQYQQELLSKDNKKGEKQPGWWSRMTSVAGGVLAANALTKAGEIGSQMAGASSGEEFVADMYGYIPVIGGALGAAKGRHIQEAEKRAKARHGLRGSVGYGSNLPGAMIGLGLDTSETYAPAEALAESLGTGKNISQNVHDYWNLNRGYSLEQSTLTGAAKLQRYDTTGRSMMGNIMNTIDLMKSTGAVPRVNGKFDTTRVEELLEMSNQLGQEQINTLESVNQTTNAQIVSAFQQVGGTFANSPQRMLQINRSLTKPGNEYQMAESYAALSQLNPDASYFDILKMQEKGLGQKGYMSKTLQQIEGQYGTGDLAKLKVMKRFGLSANQSEKLWGAYNQNPELFDKIGLDQFLRGEGEQRAEVGGRASGMTTGLEQQQAAVVEAFANDLGQGLKKIMDQMENDLSEDVTSLFSGISAGMEAAFNRILDGIGDWFDRNL